MRSYSQGRSRLFLHHKQPDKKNKDCFSSFKLRLFNFFVKSNDLARKDQGQGLIQTFWNGQFPYLTVQIITIWHILCVILKSQPRSIPRKSSLNLLTKTHPKHRIQTTMPPSKTYPETPIHNNYTTQSPQTNVDINPQNHPSRYAATTLEETQHAQKSNTKYLFGKPLQRSQTWPEKYHLINTLTSVYLSNMFQSMETTHAKNAAKETKHPTASH